MAEIPRYDFDPIAEAGYITAPHSEALDPNSQIRIGQMIVDITDRGTIRGVELLEIPGNTTKHSELIRGLISWEEYDTWVWGQIEAVRMERLRLAERAQEVGIIFFPIQFPSRN